MSQSNLSLVKIEESNVLFADSDDEVMDLQHMLLEPPLENDLSRDLMFTKPEDVKGCFVIEDSIHPIDQSVQKTDYGEGIEMLHSDVTPVRKQELKCRSQLFADATPLGYGEELFQQSKCASACPDFLPEFFLGFHASQRIDNCGPELQTRGKTIDCNETEFLELSNVFSTQSASISDEIILLTDEVHKFEYASDIGSTFGQDTYDNSRHCIKHHEILGLQSITEDEISPSFFTCSLTSNDNEGQMFWTLNHPFEGLPIPLSSISDSNGSVDEGTERCIYSIQEDTRMMYSSMEDKDSCGSLYVEDENSAVTRKKGSQECVQRSNQETSQDSQLRSTCQSGTLEVSCSANESDLSCSESMIRESKLGLLFHHEYPVWSVIQKPRNMRSRRSCQWRSPVILQNGAACNEDNLSGSGCRPTYASRLVKSDSQSAIPNFFVRSTKNVKSGGKRKQHRLWTLSEVMKLIEGVSQCGVGRWTEIKKLLFSSSASRTSVDLKDKWRNLLKASVTQLQNKKAEPRRKNMLHHIPQSLLRRIRELSDDRPHTGDKKLRSMPSSGIPTSSS